MLVIGAVRPHHAYLLANRMKGCATQGVESEDSHRAAGQVGANRRPLEHSLGTYAGFAVATIMGGFQVPLPAGSTEGGVSFGQYSRMAA